MKTRLVITLLASSAVGAQAEMGRYLIDPTHTFASFEALHLGTSLVRGRFDRKTGSVQFDRAGRAGSTEITIDMASISTGVPALDRLLQGPDYFDATEFPSARFVGSSFVFDSDKVSQVVGTLTLKGQTHPLTLSATHFNCYFSPLFKREVCGGDFEATLRRSEWGLNEGMASVGDEIRLQVQVEAVRQE